MGFAIAQPILRAPRHVLLLRLQLPLVRRDERADVVGHVEKPQPLLLVERHQKAARAVDRERAFLAHLQAQAGRHTFLQGGNLAAQAVRPVGRISEASSADREAVA